MFQYLKKLENYLNSSNLTSHNNTAGFKHMLALEPRIVFDGAIAATAAENIAEADASQSDDNANHKDNAVAIDERDVVVSDGNSDVTLVFIDMRLDDAQVLADGVDPDAHIVWLDPAKDGIVQIGQALEAHDNVSSIHLFTHAEDGELNIGSTLITADTLADNSDGLSGWSQFLTQDADILFYGCNLAETAHGESLLSEIASLTGADIAASTDLTGAEVLGGDWDLEHSTGTIEATLTINEAAQAAYAHTLAAVPEATISGLDDPLIGDTMTFTVTFDNSAGTDTGYAPYINLLVPFMGADGVYDSGTETYTDTPDGISFTSASFLGQMITADNIEEVTLVDTDAGMAGIQVEHPYAQNPDGSPFILTIEDALGFQEGDKLVVMKLPFGSFTTGQPAADIEITAQLSNLADVGTPLPIVANAGFQLGDVTALDDFDTDPPVQDASLNAGNSSVGSATPQIVTITSSFSDGEGEVASGENYEVGYDVNIEVAGGQTLDNVTVDYTYAEETVYTSATATGGTLSAAPLQDTSGNTADDLITATYTSVSGTQDTTFNFYVDEFDQGGTEVIDPTTGVSNAISIANNIVVNGTWNPIDTRDGMNVAIAPTLLTAPTVTAKAISVQKSVVNTTGTPDPENPGQILHKPGDILEYTIDFQISDYFAFDMLTLDDTFSDGQDLNATPITLDLTRQGTAEAQQTFTLNTDYTLTENTGTDYSETLAFDLSALLTSAFGSGILEGGKFAADDLNSTTGTIKFQTVIQDKFADPALGASDFVKQGDDLGNDVSIEGRNLDAGLTPFAGPQLVGDVSSAGVTIPNETLSVSVYAKNGVVGAVSTIQPGDDITFRLEFDLLTGDFEDFLATAFLPLPIFDVDDLNADGAGGDVFSEDTINAVPLVGQFRYGPDVTALVDGITITPATDINQDAAANSVGFSLGDLDDVSNAGGKIDILFTIKAGSEPFADGLPLTTLGEQADSNTAGTPAISNSLVQVELQNPAIDRIIKGIVSTDSMVGNTFISSFENDEDAAASTPAGIKVAGNTDANPLTGSITSANLESLELDSNVSDVDAGDLVRFAIVVENIGSSPNGAFDVTISEDSIPAGFVIPGSGLNLRAVNGAGTALAIDNASPDVDLFTAGGITFTDGGTGALADGGQVNGSNIAIITYDLEVASTAEALGEITSEARLTNYSNENGGDDFTAVDLKDTATTTIAGATITKTLDATSEGVVLQDVVIGEIVTYTSVITIPEGVSNLAEFVDTLDTGMAFLDATNVTITPSAGVALGSSTITFDQPGGGDPEDINRRMNIDFGTITNTNTDNTAADTITITYDAVVLNTDDNNASVVLDETATYTSDNEPDISASADDVTIREPSVSVTVTPNNANVDASDTITWTVVVTAAAGTGADAHEVTLADVIPSDLTYVGASLMNTAGEVPTTLTETGGTIDATWATLTPGQTSTFTFQTTVDSSVSLGQALDNVADLNWSSLSGTGNADLAGAQSTFDSERDGTDGAMGGMVGMPDDYLGEGTGTVTVLFNAPTLVVDETSEASNGGDATVGEIVRYRFTVQVPESTTTDFRVEPEIPLGMQFLDDGTATIAFVSDGGLSSDSGTLTGGALDIVGDETTVATDEPAFTLAGANINAGANGSGDNPQFLLGEISNTDNDANQEFIVIEYNVLVLNETGVDDGDMLSSDAEVLSNTTSLVTSNSVDVDVVEPEITNLEKIVTTTDGSTATFQITFENMSGVDAFDVNLSDVLPANLTNLANVVITPAGGTVLDTDNSTGTGLDIDLTTMPDGGSITVTYTADIIDDTIVVADTDADVTWTSVPGTASSLSGSTSGAAGSASGERTGSEVGENDYIISEGAGLNVISGTLFEDINQDEIIDGTDPKLNNTQINITYLGEDGVLGGGDDVTVTTLTDVNGDYSVGAMPSGNYQISVQPPGMANGLPTGYTALNDATGSDTDNLIEFPLGEGVSSTPANFGVLSPNSAPTFTGLGGADPDVTHVEGASPTVLDSNAVVADPELGTNALDDWDGATLTLERNTSANAADVFSGTGTLAALTEGGNITVGGSNVGTVTTNSGGTLVLTFGNDATTADVNSVMQQIGYSYSGDNPPTDITIDYTINDKNVPNAQGSGAELTATGSVNVDITATNDLPSGADNTIDITEDNAHTFVAGDFGFTDPDIGDTFQDVRIDTLPPNGTLTLGGVPVTMGQIIPVGSIGTLVYMPDLNLEGDGADSFTFSVRDSAGGFDAAPNTIDFDIDPVNDAPSFTNLGGANPDVTHVEGGGLTALDPDATLVDPELTVDDDWNGSVLTLVRQGGADAEDLFDTVGPDLMVLVEGNPLVVGATTIGTVTTNSAGVLELTFNGNATNALVNQALQQIGYEFDGNVPPASVPITYTINDGNVTNQGSGGALSDNTGIINVAITATNDAPNGADNILNLNEDDRYTFSEADFGYTDPDVTDTFTNLRIDTIPTNGELLLNGVPVVANQIIPASQISNLVFVPVAHESGNNYGDFTFSVGDQSGLGNAFDPTPNMMTINLAPVSDGPAINAPDISTLPGESVPVVIDLTLIDMDGSESIDNTVTIGNIPNGVQVFGPGMTPIPVVGGSVTLTLADLADLTFSPSSTTQGTFNLTVTGTTVDGVAAPGTTVETFVLQVRSPVEPPILPPSTGNVPGTGVSGSFSPFVGGATGTDIDGDGLTDGYKRFDTGAVQPNFLKGNDYFRDIARIDIYLTGTIDDQLMLINKDNSIKIPKNIFRHSDPSEKFTYKVEMADGGPIPSWLEFDEENLSFKGVPPEGTRKTLEFVIIAKDSKNNEAKARFKIVVNRDIDVLDNPKPAEASQESGEAADSNQNQAEEAPEENKQSSLENVERLDFAEQVEQTTKMSRYAKDQAFIDSLAS